jgi:cyclopropane fatty-acyl-phospholipid synthase-like methyltransferase
MNNKMNANQSHQSVNLNQGFFKDNNWYKDVQNELEIYQFISKSATHETKAAKRLLDIGNGGVFIYPIDHIDDVNAIDIFVEEDFKLKYPRVRWSQMSALDLIFDQPFDTIIAINTLHHIIGDDVASTYKNLHTVMNQVSDSLCDDGRFVLLESTVPKWFIFIYKKIFNIFTKIWPLKHPPTFQFHYRDIISSAKSAGLSLEEFCWIPKTSDVMFLGFRVNRFLSPIRMGKFIFSKTK